MGGDLKKRKGNGGIMRHDVASATQTFKSEKRGCGEGGGGEGGISCEMDKGDRSGRGSVYVCALKATMFVP